MTTHRNVRLLAIHNFFLDFRPYAAIAIIYFADITGSFALGMAVCSAVMVSAAALEVPTGIFSDMIGRKRSIIFGSAASVASLFFYALGGSFWILLIGAFCEGASRSFFSGNNDALLHDTLRDEGKVNEYAELLGKTSSMFQLALATGALCAAFLVVFPLQVIVWISVLPQLCGLVVSFLFVEPRMHDRKSTNIFSHLKESLLEFRRNAKLRLLNIGSVIQFGIGESMFQLTPAFIAILWPPWGIGIARMLNHTFGWLSFWYAGKLIRRYTALRCLFAANITIGVIGLIAFGFPSISSPLLLASGSLFYGLFTVSQNSLLQKEFTEKQRATMGSINSLFGSLFFGVCAIFLGFLADRFTVQVALLVAEIGMLSVLPVYWRLFRHE